MSKPNRSEKRDTRAQDYVVNKLLCVFTLAFLLILGLVYVSNLMESAPSYVKVFKAMPWIAAGFGVLTVVSVVFAILAKVKAKDNAYRLVTAKHLAFVFGFTALCALALSLAFTKDTLTFLYILIPVVAVLYIIFHTYPREFFAIAALGAVGALAGRVLSSLITVGIYPFFTVLLLVVALILVALLIVGTAVAQKQNGKLFGRQVFDTTALYLLIYLTAILVAANLLVTFFLGRVGYTAATAVLLGYLLSMAAFYTLRKM